MANQLWLLTAIYIAESTWSYLVAAFVVSMSNSGRAFSAAAVLGPYAAAALFTALLINRRAAPLSAFAAAAYSVLNLLAGGICLLATIWWELYRDHRLLDPSWVSRAVADARSLGGGQPAMAWLVVLVVFLWWRGTCLARGETDFPQLLGRFLWGTAVLLALAAISGATTVEPAPGPFPLAAYVVFGLGAVAAARLEIAQTGRLGGVDVQWRWWALLLAFLAVAAGLGIGSFALPLLGELARSIRELAVDVLLPLLLEILRWLAHLLGLDRPPPPVALEPQGGFRPPVGAAEEPFIMPDWIRQVARGIFNLSWIGLILYGVYSWIRQWRWRPQQDRRHGFTRKRLPWRLKLAVTALLCRLLRPLAARWPTLRRWLQWLQTAQEPEQTVREIYRRLLAWGAEHGCRREPCATPREYQKLLSGRWPLMSDEFGTITESYIRARYGNVALADEEVNAAMLGWLRITRQRAHEAPK